MLRRPKTLLGLSRTRSSPVGVPLPGNAYVCLPRTSDGRRWTFAERIRLRGIALFAIACFGALLAASDMAVGVVPAVACLVASYAELRWGWVRLSGAATRWALAAIGVALLGLAVRSALLFLTGR
jgi:hypothetical protein